MNILLAGMLNDSCGGETIFVFVHLKHESVVEEREAVHRDLWMVLAKQGSPLCAGCLLQKPVVNQMS